MWSGHGDNLNELTLDDVKALSVSIDDLPLPSNYSSLGRNVSDASTNLQAVYWNVVRDEIGKKQMRKTRQSSALPFSLTRRKIN